MTYNIRAAFSNHYNGEKNFMTPTIVRYGKKENLIYEVSKGSGLFDDNIIYGLSVLCADSDREDRTSNTDFSGCYDSLEEIDEQ